MPEAFRAWARDQVAQLEIEYNVGRLLCYHTAWTIDEGKTPTTQAAMCKAFCTQYEQRVNDVASQILGPACQIRRGIEWSPLRGDLAESLLWGPSYTLQGGSVEILKNIVALRGLGLLSHQPDDTRRILVAEKARSHSPCLQGLSKA